MKKKFDFSAEMAEAESIKSNPNNESLEEENRLLDINAQELVKLNDNVFKLRTEVENLSGLSESVSLSFLQKCRSWQ